MSTIQPPHDQNARSLPIGNANNGVTSDQDRNQGQAVTGAPVSNDHSNPTRLDAAQGQTSLGRNASKRPIPPSTSRYYTPKSKRGKYISKAWRVCAVLHRQLSRIVIRSLSQQVAELQDNIQQLRNDRRTSVATVVSPGEGLDLAPAHTAPASLRRPPSHHAFSVAPQEDPVDLAHATPSSITPSSVGHSRQPTVNYTFNLELARQYACAQGARTGEFEPNDPAKPANCTHNGSPVAPDSSYLTNSSIDPLWLLDKQEALRLCHVYEEEIGISYPFLTLSVLIDNAHKLYDAMEAGSRAGFAFSSLPGPTFIDHDDVDILRLVLSTALTIESSGSSELGNSLFAKAQEKTSSKIWEPTSLKSIAFFTLMAIHSFLSGDDLQAWRLIGIPARSCLELGLHQEITYTKIFKESSERQIAIRLFWSIHTLDRRWSFGAGLPFVIQSNDIDLNMPWPDDEVPYLQAMVAYNRIGTNVWATLYNAGSTASKVPRDEIDFLHYSVERWYSGISVGLKLHQDGAPPPSRGVYRLQILLYLRACQMKILLHQPALHAIPLPSRDSSQVQMVVDIAKDMIQKLHNLNQTTDIYQTQQVCFNHFLVSALGVIFLAVALEPAVYRDTVRQEFNTALDLVRGFSKRSYVSRRLWKMIRGLQQAGVRLGISAQHHDGGAGQATGQATPEQTGRMPSPPIPTTSVNPVSRPSQINDSWLGKGMAPDRRDGLSILDGMEMTMTLNDFLAAAESDNGLWGMGVSPETSGPSLHSTCDAGTDHSKRDFGHILDNFL